MFALVVTVCWFLVALPFALVYNALKNTLSSAHEHLKTFSERLWEKSRAVLGSVREPVADFVAQSRQKIFFYERERDFHQRMALVRSQLSEIDDRTSKEIAGLSSNTKALSDDLIELNEIDLSHRSVEIPDYADEHELIKMRRSGWTLIWTTGPFLLALIFLNTGMLSLFFNEMIPIVKWFLGISLQVGYLFAFVFSGFEVALGVILFIHGNEKSDISDKQTVRNLIVSSIAVLAFIEAVIYAKLSMGFAGVEIKNLKELFEISLFEFFDAIWITPLGVVIVIGLALLGHTFIKGIYRVRDSGDYDAFRDQLDKAHAVTTKTMELAGRGRDKIDSLKDRLTSFLGDVQGITDDGSDLGEKLSAVTKNIRTAADETKGLKTGLYIDVPEPDILREYYKSLFLASLGLILIVFFGLIQTRLLSTAPIFSELPDFMKGLLAFLLVGTLVGSGHVLAQKLILAEGDVEVTVQESPQALFMRIAALIAIAAIVFFTTYITLYGQIETDWASLLLMLALIAFSVLLGSSLRVFLQALWAFIRSVVRGLLAVSIWLSALLVAVCSIAMNLIAVVLWVLAYPILRILEHYGQGNLINNSSSENQQ